MKAETSLQLYVWERCFLLRAASLALTARARPYRRPSATLILTRTAPFTLQAGDTAYHGVVMAPQVPRHALIAVSTDVMVLDLGVDTPEFAHVRPALPASGLRVLDASECAQLLAQCPPLAALDEAAATQAFENLLDAWAALGGGTLPPAPAMDARLQRALEQIAQRPYDELSLDHLAQAAQLSPSRLRSLFQQQFGSAPMPYARWRKAWQAIRVWRPGMSFTEAAHHAGFYDLAHIDHTFRELFGMSPSALTTASGVHFVPCAALSRR